MTIATLQMYDLPEVRAATDDWWAGLARALRRAGLSEVPARLTRDGPPEGPWREPGFLLGQTCGYPLMHGLAGVVQVVATPAYDAPGCQGPQYRSVFLVRDDEAARSLAELRGRIAAANSPQSQSGYSALRSAVAPLARDGKFFAQVIETGGHVQWPAPWSKGGRIWRLWTASPMPCWRNIVRQRWWACGSWAKARRRPACPT